MFKKSILLTAILALALGLANTAFADTWTGCVNPGGQIHHLRQGDAPMKPCHKNGVIIHLSDLASKTSATQFTPDQGATTGTLKPGATYDHDLVCKALGEAAGVENATLDALGCPLGTEPVPTGMVTQTFPSPTGPLDIGSCSDNAAVGCFKVSDAFVGNQFMVPNQEFALNRADTGFCPTACNSDERCFMAWLENAELPISGRGTGGGDHPSLVCHLFYRAEGINFEHYCGHSLGECGVSLATSQPFWDRPEEQPMTP